MAKTLGTPWQKLGHEVPASELEGVDLYWRASNYLSVGQIYLRSNPLMRTDFVDEKTGETRDFGRPDVKHRLVGHWGTTPGINFLFGHVNRLIADHNQNAIFLMGPGHGGPAGTAQSLLDGTYREIRPDIADDEAGLQKFFRQFSYPGGIPSHFAPETPGSIHEGGELGYTLSHAYGAVMDNPSLLAVAVVGDGESETGPLATSWQSNKLVNPKTDGIVLPILHLNGYKIANPTILARISDEELTKFFEGMGYEPQLSRKGNVLVELGGQGSPLVLAAHVDTLGAMVRSVKKTGRLRPTTLGGHQWSTADGENCTVHTRDGRVYTGVVLNKEPSAHVADKKTEIVEENMEILLDEQK